MSKSKKQGAVADPAKALAELETPTMKWSAMAQIAGGFAVLWLVGFMVTPYVGNWGLGVVGVLTLVAMGFGIYVWRLTSRSRGHSSKAGWRALGLSHRAFPKCEPSHANSEDLGGGGKKREGRLNGSTEVPSDGRVGGSVGLPPVPNRDPAKDGPGVLDLGRCPKGLP